jgi:hypothetical protein
VFPRKDGQAVQVGEEWGYRELGDVPGSTLLRAVVIQLGPKQSQRVRVRVEGGQYPGLEQWLPRRRFLAPWGEAEAFVADETRLAALLASLEDSLDKVTYDAMETVFAALSSLSDIAMGWRRGEENVLRIERFADAVASLGLNPVALLDRPGAFIDRFGTYHGDWRLAAELAPILAVRFRERVLASVAKEERELRHKAVHGSFVHFGGKHPVSYETTPEHCQEQLAEELPVYRLVRLWCGEGEQERWDETQALRAELVRLHGLVERSIELLRQSGHPNYAKRLEQDLRGDQYETREKARLAQRRSWGLSDNS